MINFKNGIQSTVATSNIVQVGKFCDLHTHSTFSDGTDTPTELIRKAEQAKLAVIALTDHNSVAGLPEFMKAAKDSNIIAVPGVEFTTAHAGKELHVVGLFIKEEVYQQVEDYCEPMRKAKEISNRLLIDNLRKAGYAVEYEEMVNYVQVENINRAVIASYLIEKRIIKTREEGFRTILSERGGYYVPSPKPSTLETIQFIKSIGGVAVLAHPLLEMEVEELRDFLPEAKQHGLDAIETNYSTYDSYKKNCALRLVRENELLFSGGSDYHGKNKPMIKVGVGKGNLKVPMEYYTDLAKRAEKK